MADNKFDPLNPARVAEVDRVVSRALKPRSPVSYEIHKTDEVKTIEAAVDVKRQAEAVNLVKREAEIRKAADKVVAAQAKEDLKAIEVAEKASAARNKFLLSNKQLKNWEWEVLINRVSTISLGLGPVRFLAPLEYKAAKAQDVVDVSRSNDRIVDGTPTPSITRPTDAGGPFSWRTGTEYDPELHGDESVGQPRTKAEEEQVKAAEKALLERDRLQNRERAQDRNVPYDPTFAYPPVVLDRDMTPAERKAVREKLEARREARRIAAQKKK